MRAAHGISKMSTEDCNRYRADGEEHVDRFTQELRDRERRIHELEARQPSRGINMTPIEFNAVIDQVQRSINAGIERGLHHAVQLSSLVNHDALESQDFYTRKVTTRPNTNNFMVSIGNVPPLASMPSIGHAVTSTAVFDPIPSSLMQQINQMQQHEDEAPGCSGESDRNVPFMTSVPSTSLTVTSKAVFDPIPSTSMQQNNQMQKHEDKTPGCCVESKNSQVAAEIEGEIHFHRKPVCFA